MTATPPASLAEQLHQHGFIHADTLSVVKNYVDTPIFQQFQQSWDELPADKHLSDNGHYRFRRYSVFTHIDGVRKKLPREPHFQPRSYNHLHGGIYRHFSELTADTLSNPVLSEVIDWNISLISVQQANWRIQCHQFRICASEFEAGKPAPEGVHQDGADYVFIMLVNRNNVSGAENTIHTLQGEVIYKTTLQMPGEALLVDDRRYFHGVSDIVPKDPQDPATRDVLVLTFHAI